jgi:CxxC-x17-CxxC domain-containing protein
MLAPPRFARANGSFGNHFSSVQERTYPVPDKTIVCVDCGSQFVFTEGEQEFYAQKGFTNEPTRCPTCRAARKASRSSGSYSSDRGGERQMYPAVCAQCGKATEVPFQPRGDKPVYCSDCYSQRRGSSGGSYSSGRSSGGYGSRSGSGGKRPSNRDRDGW